MSLCYDFEKWTMISLASIAITMTVGLVLMQYGHGQTTNETTTNQTSKVPTGKFESKDLSVINLRTGVDNNRIVIAGTIKNISDEPISGITFVAQTFNATDGLTGTIGTSGPRLPLEPQQEYSFEIPTSNIPTEVDHYTVSVSSDR